MTKFWKDCGKGLEADGDELFELEGTEMCSSE
jgi:hypothetical protein